MKIILCIFIVSLSGVIGIIAGNIYNKKSQYFGEIYMFFNFLKLKIAFFKNKLNICIKEFIESSNPKLELFSRLETLANKGQLTTDNLSTICPSSFTEEERKILSQFLILLSAGDIDTVSQTIYKAAEYSKEKQNAYFTLAKSRGVLIKKLSICIGILICIFIY